MSLVDLDGVTAERPGKPLFTDLRLTIGDGDRLGVVGINGVGKSTLLRLVAGVDEPEQGVIRRRRDLRVSTLDQRPDIGATTVRDAVGTGWQADAALDRLGVAFLADQAVSALSGGQAKRVALAGALMSDADLIVLDEPTNHLDLATIVWLEERLAAMRSALVVVTHDRAFLDRVTTRMLALAGSGEWYLHDGGYRSYLEAAAERAERAARAEASRQILARQELAWLRRGARARRRKPKARLVMAHRTVDGGPEADGERVEDLALETFGAGRLGRRVIELDGVGFAHPGHPPLITGVDLRLDRRSRLGIIGPNGAGKSTLLDVLAGRRAPTEGTVTVGSTVEIGYLDQHGTALDPDVRVRDAVAGPGGVPDHTHAALLARFWFERDAQYAPISSLSGGERRRLELLTVLAARPNVLLLDEPTNDLDLETLRALEGLLDDWAGAVVAVSHDRAFLERTVEHVIAVDGGTVELVAGGAAVWERGQGSLGGERGGPSTGDGRQQPVRSGPSRSTLRFRLSEVERDLAAAESARAEALDALAEPPADHEELARLSTELAEAEEAVTVLEERWLEVSTLLEEAGRASGGTI